MIVAPIRLGDESPPCRVSSLNRRPVLQHGLITKQSSMDNGISPNHVPMANEDEHDESLESEELYISTSVDNHLSQNYSRRQLYNKQVSAKDAYVDAKLLLYTRVRDLRVTKKDLATYKRKIER